MPLTDRAKENGLEAHFLIILADGVQLVALHDYLQCPVGKVLILAELAEVDDDRMLKTVNPNHAVNQALSQLAHFISFLVFGIFLSLSDCSIAKSRVNVNT